jgi:hypothetical protein
MLVGPVMSSSISILVLCCSCVSFIASNRNSNEIIQFFSDFIFTFSLVLPHMLKMLSNPANLLTLIRLLIWGSRGYPNGQGSWARPGWSRRCARALPFAAPATRSGLRLCPCGSRYVLTVWASPWQQLKKFIYYN